MTTSYMYKTSVPVFKQLLTSLSAILTKAEAYAAGKKFEPAVLLNARLYPDMFPLIRQVQVAADFAKSVSARLAGVEVPAYEDNEQTFADLQARIARTLAFIESLTPAQFEGSETRDIVLRPGTPKEKKMIGHNYLINYGLPQFFFHVTTAYAILRHNGLDVGKGAGVRGLVLSARCGWRAAFTLAVVQAGQHKGLVHVVVDEAHQHFLPNAGDELLAHARSRAALHDPHPATVVAVGTLWCKGVGLPVELDLDAAHAVGVDLICANGSGAAVGADHNGRLRPPGGCAGAGAQAGVVHQHGAPRYVAAYGLKLVGVAALGCLGLQRVGVHIVALKNAAVLAGLLQGLQGADS